MHSRYSFQERLALSVDQFYFPPEDLRSKVEFYQPMVVYLFIFLCFFLAILRKWEPIRRQFFWIYEDARFQASAAFGIIALVIMALTFVYGLQNYRLNNPPIKIPLMIIFGIIHYCYCLAAAVERELSPLRAETSAAYVYPLGYLPVALVIGTLLISSWKEDNEDVVVRKVRQERDAMLGMEMLGDVRAREREQRNRNKAAGPTSPRERSTLVNKVDSLESQYYNDPLPPYRDTPGPAPLGSTPR